MRRGPAVLLASLPLQIVPLLPGWPFVGWAVAGLGLWLCREDPTLARGVRPAAVALAVFAVLGLVGLGVTIGTGAGAVASGGGETDGLQGLSTGILLALLAPPALLFGLSGTARERRLALAAVALSLLLFAVPAIQALNHSPRLEVGDLVISANLLTLLAVLGYVALLSTLGWRRVRERLAAAEA